jgi:cyclopropane-fatty-acyl-phospholipid synthase
MWEFYLTGSEACFRLGQHVNCQFQLVKKVGVVPMTRTYIAEREEALRLRDGANADQRMAEAAPGEKPANRFAGRSDSDRFA